MPAQPLKASNTRAPRVLIVDDAAGMRAYLNVIFASVGFDCEEAADGAEAFGIVMAGGIDLLVTDLDMPVMDGFQLIAALGLLPASHGRPPIIVVSGLLDETTALRRPELRQASALLAKPVQPADLLKCAARVMGARASLG